MRSILLAIVVLLAAQVRAVAADPAVAWRGVKVLPKLDAVVKVGNETIREFGDPTLHLPWMVQDVKGEWLWVGDERKGWVQRSQVVTLDEAPTYYTEVIRSGKDKLWAYNLRAWTWKEKGDLDLAIADYGEALRLDPSPRVYNNRGEAWYRKGEYSKAVADFNQAIRINPNYASPYTNRGVVWLKKKEYDKAIADFNDATRVDPKSAVACANRGEAWRAKKEYEKAIADYNQAIHLDPNYAESYNNAAWLRATCPEPRFRNGTKAVALATQACKLSGWSDFNKVDTLAAAYAEARDSDSAIKYQNKAVALNPTDAEFVKGAKERIALYKHHKPYREE